MPKIDLTGLVEVPMVKLGGRLKSDWSGSYYLDRSGDCVAKTCSKCRDVLSSEEFGKASRFRYGLNSRCKPCNRSVAKGHGGTLSPDGVRSVASVRSADWSNKNIERSDDEIYLARSAIHPSGTKTCRKCQVDKLFSEYHLHRRRLDGLAESCKTCVKIYDKARHSGEYREHWRAKGIPEKCYVCLGEYEDIEHVVPLNVGGEDTPENTLPSCILCNRGVNGKHTKLLIPWLESRDDITDKDEILRRVLQYGVDPYPRI